MYDLLKLFLICFWLFRFDGNVVKSSIDLDMKEKWILKYGDINLILVMNIWFLLFNMYLLMVIFIWRYVFKIIFNFYFR